MLVHADRLFPADPSAATSRAGFMRKCGICRSSRLTVIPIRAGTRRTSRFPDPATLFVVPDHYIFRMLYSQGMRLEDLGIAAKDGSAVERDPRAIWRLFAAHYHLFRGTPTRAWLDHTFATLFGFTERLSAENADDYYDRIDAALRTPEFRPRALFERFGIEAIATTESPLDPLKHHETIRQSGWGGRVITAYRPDPVVDPEFEGFRRESRALRRAHRLRHRHLERLSRGASQAPRVLPRIWRDLHRSRSSDRADRRSLARPKRRPCSAASRPRARARGCGAVPRPDADRDGGDERRGRDGHADPSRLVPQPQRRHLPPLRPRHGRRHSLADRLCPRAQAAARPLRQRAEPDASSSSRWTRRAIRANWRRSPAIIRR